MVTAAAGVRLITIDRPGYGGSDLTAEAVTIPSLADDAAMVLHELGATDVAAVGWSAGGRLAMALAARHPDLVRSVDLLAAPAPDEDVPWYPEEVRPMVDALRQDPDGAVAAMTPMLAPMTSDAAGAVGQLGVGPADEALLLERPGLLDGVTAMLTEAFRAGAGGLAADIVSYTVHDWGFDPRAVGVPVRCWYGADDQLVTPAHGEWWCDQALDSSLRVVGGVGHLVPYVVWADVLPAAGRVRAG